MAIKKKTKIEEYDDSFELMYEFKDCLLDVYFDPDMIEDNLQKKIIDTVDIMSRDICIDKSYVQCPENKHKDVFLTELGWNMFKRLMLATCYGKIATDTERKTISTTYMMMIKSYMYEILMKLFPDDFMYVHLDMIEGTKFNVEIRKDYSNDWKSYPGKWQTWKKDKLFNLKKGNNNYGKSS